MVVRKEGEIGERWAACLSFWKSSFIFVLRVEGASQQKCFEKSCYEKSLKIGGDTRP